MPIGASALTSDGDISTGAMSFDTAAVNPAAGSMLLLFIDVADAGLTVSTQATVTGCASSWANEVIQTIGGGGWFHHLYIGTGTFTNEAITMDWGAEAISRIGWIVIEVTGADVGGTPVVQSSSNQTNSVTLSAFASANNRIFSSTKSNSAALTPGTSFTELADLVTTYGTCMQAQWRSDTAVTTASVSGNSGDTTTIALEVAAAAAGGSTRSSGLTLLGVG